MYGGTGCLPGYTDPHVDPFNEVADILGLIETKSYRFYKVFLYYIIYFNILLLKYNFVPK